MSVIILGGGGFRVPLIAQRLAASGLLGSASADAGASASAGTSAGASPAGELVLYDTDTSRLAVIASVLAGDPATAGLPVRAVTRLDEALPGAGLIFSAIRAGGLDGRVRDERAALRLGLLGQETVGAGGLTSAARAVPAADALARRVAELAPGAWVISMTNPAGIVTETMTAVLGDRVIGVCDSPVGLIRRVCAACGTDPGPDLGAVAGRVDAGYLGINHLGWLRSLTVDGADLLPSLLADGRRLASFEEGRLFGPDVIRALGAVPNEYLYWYYAAAEALRDVTAAGRTRGEHVRERQLAFYSAAADAGPPEAARLWREANDERNRSYFAELRTGEAAGERDEADVAAGGYESVAVALARALSGGPAARLILNVRNGAGFREGADVAVPGLAAETVVEVPCRVGAAGPVPLPVPPPTPHELGLMSVVRGCERDIAAAALSDSPAQAEALALRGFATHPLVGSLAAARALAAATFPR